MENHRILSMPFLILWLIDNTSRFVWCQFWTGFLKQMCGTFCISLVWRVWRDCSCGISKLWYLQDCGLDKLQLELALSCNEKIHLCIYIMEAANFCQTMAAAVVVVVHFTMFLLEQGGFFVTRSHLLDQCWTKVFVFLEHIFRINVQLWKMHWHLQILLEWWSFLVSLLEPRILSWRWEWRLSSWVSLLELRTFIMKVRMKIVILGKFGFGWPFLWKNFVRIVPWPKLFFATFLSTEWNTDSTMFYETSNCGFTLFCPIGVT